MFRTFLLVAAGLSLIATPAAARQRQYTAQGHTLPADKPVTVLLMRPDVEVGQLQAGGAIEPNADWTAAARSHFAEAMRANQASRNITLRPLDEQAGDAAQMVADYEALHRAVADAIITYKYYGARLPTKRGRFDWTLGPGTQRLAEASGANYALFFFGRDNFASSGRKAVQAVGILGCLIGICVIANGGQHVYYASLVELSSGDIVWFNVQRGSAGDIRTAEGARALVDTVMQSMPSRPGEGVEAPPPAPRRAGR